MKVQKFKQKLNNLENKIDQVFASKELFNLKMQHLEVLINQFTDDELGKLLQALVDLPNDDKWLNEVALRSYQHGNGFFKLVLVAKKDYKIRLHVWADSNVGKETVHNHRWWFASRIVTGHIESEIWQLGGLGDVELESLLYFSDNDGRTSQKVLGKSALFVEDNIKHSKGDSYHLSPNILHAIVGTSSGVTATLMVTTTPCRTFNEMYTNHEIDVTKRQSTPEAIKDIVTKLLEQLS